MNWCQVLVFFVYLDDQILYKTKLIYSDAVELLLREQLYEKLLELL